MNIMIQEFVYRYRLTFSDNVKLVVSKNHAYSFQEAKREYDRIGAVVRKIELIPTFEGA